MTKKVSLKDIAKKAGVSVTLVSYVLNNKHVDRINEKTANRIRETARKMKYRTNQIARSLKTSRTDTIGLIVSNISNPFSAAMARIIQDAADKMNYTVIFGSSDEQAEKAGRLINTLINRQVDGLILSLPSHSEDEIRNLQNMKIPFVLLDRYFPDIPCSYVALDNFAASQEVVGHIISTGRKRIALVSYQTDLFHLRERKRGYMAALKKAGITYDRKLVKMIPMNSQETSIIPAINDLLENGIGTDAILFANNNLATEGLKLINRLPVRVPDQLALASFDQTPMLDLFYAPVTYMRQPLQQLGDMAFEVLLRLMAGSKTLEQINLKGELVVRQSTAAKRGKD